jgi:hypothetical protein
MSSNTVHNKIEKENKERKRKMRSVAVAAGVTLS